MDPVSQNKIPVKLLSSCKTAAEEERLPLLETQQLLKEQHEALLAKLDSWMEAHEERLGQIQSSLEGAARYKPLLATSMSSKAEYRGEPAAAQKDVSDKPGKYGAGLNPRGVKIDVDAVEETALTSADMPPEQLMHPQLPGSSPSSNSKLPDGVRSERGGAFKAANSEESQAFSDDGVSPRSGSPRKAASTPVQVQSVSDKLNSLNEKEIPEGGILGCCKTIMTHPAFEGYFAFLIISNAFWIGFELQMSIDAAPEKLPDLYLVVGHAFSVNFVIELTVRLLAERSGFCGGPNFYWNVFDSVLVSTSVFELFLDIYKVLAMGTLEGGNTGLSNMRLFRIVRITRLIRLFRIARVLRFVRALSLLIFSIMITMRSLVWATVLMSLIIYFFAIVICQGVTNHLNETCNEGPCPFRAALDESWGSLPRASMSLFQIISGGKDWDDLTRPLGSIDSSLTATVLVFIVFSQFAVLNVVTGVFCQGAVESAQRDREIMVQSLLTNKQVFIDTIGSQFAQMFNKMGGGGGGGLSLEVFEHHLQEKSVREYFALLDLDVSDAWMLFKLLDEDGSGEIDIEEFVDGCLKLKGNARSIDLAKIGHESKHANRSMSSALGEIRNALAGLGGVVTELQGLQSQSLQSLQREKLPAKSNGYYSEPPTVHFCEPPHASQLQALPAPVPVSREMAFPSTLSCRTVAAA
eukprot:TRINITY_DN64016_c0_g1_i1.p1 TRINITY_DN64016_c0_g1~~TRINITY_DN64016_c0_g1_i1.p1  ORF type:complete len:711 (-),score=138.33 TRINITY_DN64016_c0_g1_i1:135-2213(-)